MKSKRDYQLAFQIVKSVIDDWDPMFLLESGCPNDEYESEIASIVRQIPRIKSNQDAALAISRVLSSSFDSKEFPPDACSGVGEKLFESLTTNRLIDGST